MLQFLFTYFHQHPNTFNSIACKGLLALHNGKGLLIIFAEIGNYHCSNPRGVAEHKYPLLGSSAVVRYFFTGDF